MEYFSHKAMPVFHSITKDFRWYHEEHYVSQLYLLKVLASHLLAIFDAQQLNY